MRALDGPAKGQSILIRRCPKYLRVVYDQVTNKWDALDQESDEPGADEVCYAYLMVPGTHGSTHICYRGKDSHKSSWYESGSYTYIADIDDAQMRYRETWLIAVKHQVEYRRQDESDPTAV